MKKKYKINNITAVESNNRQEVSRTVRNLKVKKSYIHIEICTCRKEDQQKSKTAGYLNFVESK